VTMLALVMTGFVEGLRASGMSDQDRRALQECCAGRGITALGRVFELGLNDDHLLDDRTVTLSHQNRRAQLLAPLRGYPGLQELADTMKANRRGR
jgi:hypothetical protein